MEEEEGHEDLDMIVGVARQIATTSRTKPRTSSTVFTMQESLKEKIVSFFCYITC